MKNFILIWILILTINTSWATEKNSKTLQQKYDRRLEEMKKLDKNQDGILQAEELQENVGSKFDAADKNKDGIISPQEMQAVMDGFKAQGQETYGNTTNKKVRRLENRYDNADVNKDGKVLKQEYEAYFGGRYMNYDRDGDGIVTEKEYRTDSEKVPSSYLKKGK